MEKLSDLDLKPSYHKGQDDIAEEFYLPCLKKSKAYDRAVGYFKSSIYTLAWPSLKSFVENGGKIRIICSPVLASEDREALTEGYEARSKSDIGDELKNEIEGMLDDPVLEKPTRVLASLVAMGVIDFKLAFVGPHTDPRHKRLFHDKLGIFREGSPEDENSNAVVFKGSMNETWSGLASDGNLESVDVFLSWGDQRDTKRVKSESEYFDDLWNNEYPSVEIQEFPEVANQVLISASDVDQWPELVDEINEEIKQAKKDSPDQGPNPRTPLSHQKQALEAWQAQDRQGILKHATGAGKTFTAICAIRDALKNGEIPVVFVPSNVLLEQWKEELTSTNQDLEPKLLVCGGGNNEWKKDALLRSWTRRGDDPRIVLTTVHTARTSDFRRLVQDGDHLFFVADEVHRMGSEENQNILDLESGPRLGLSATPERFGDPDGTQALLDYFGGIVEPPFTLSDAIKSGRLTPYFYHVHTVRLTPGEQDDWNEETSEIGQLYAQAHSGDTPDENLLERIKHLQIQRARILKNARNKTGKAIDVIKENYEPGQRWLVYCEGLTQLNQVLQLLRDEGLNALEYHSKMEGDREQTLNYFEDNGGIVVSIKCLDEGVNIPNATHALILASSKNPREFVQRRGRVLRKAQNKYIAHVHDTVVMPYEIDSESPITSIIESELGRAIRFGEDAENPKAVSDLKSIAVEYGIDYEEVANEGIEID